MANPRKFSEKIALHNQKQAEETAAFEKIMREVSDATNKAEEATLAGQYGLGGCRSGGASPARTAGVAGGPRGRTSSSVGPMRRPADRKHDTSPYGSTVYLSPPGDSSWRRTNSDSALHQACDSQPSSHMHLSHMSHAHPHHNHRRGDMQLTMAGTGYVMATQRPRSSCEIPRIPNANSVYESGGDGGGGGGTGDTGGGGMLCAEMSVPGGSLPDLTSVHYHPPAPHHPSAHSPHSPADQEYHARYSSGGSGGGGSPGGGSAGSGGTIELAPYDPQNHLSVPNTNNYLHHSKNICGVEATWMSSSFAAPHCSPPSQYSSASNINLNSPTIAASPGSDCAGGESPQPNSTTDYNNLHQALLQPFEQITMLDSPAGVPPYPAHAHYVNHEPHPVQHYVQSPEPGRRARDPVAGGGGGLYGTVAGGGLCSPAPPAIPDIILTDYSCGVEAEWGMGGAGGGDGDGAEEAALRAGLDLDELALLEEPSALLPDAAVEHEFRLGRL